MNTGRICIKCGKVATKWTNMALPTPVCDDCALEEAKKEWKRVSFQSFCLMDFYEDFPEEKLNNTNVYSSSLIRQR